MPISKASSNAVAPAAKGDLVVGTTTNDSGILGVGSNGETLVADSSQTTGLRYNPQNALANPIINGGMDIWQRGTSVAVAASTSGPAGYTADRWQLFTNANQAMTVSRQLVGDSTNLPNIQYCARVQRNSGQTGTSGAGFAYNFETANSVPYAGKTITVSFYARAGANYSPTSSILQLNLGTGTGTDQNLIYSGFTGAAYPIISNFTLTTTWQRFAATATLSSTTNEICLYWNYSPTGTAGANDYFEVTGVQIDLGTYTASTAPTFRRAGGNIAGELAACQRYYQRITVDAAYSYLSTFSLTTSTSTLDLLVPLTTVLRTAPTSVETSNVAITDSGSAFSGGTWTINNSLYQKQLIAVRYTHTSAALTQYRSYAIQANVSSAAYLGFSAEL